MMKRNQQILYRFASWVGLGGGCARCHILVILIRKGRGRGVDRWVDDWAVCMYLRTYIYSSSSVSNNRLVIID